MPKNKKTEQSESTTIKSGNGYPFPTQKEIVAQIETSHEFRVQCLNILVQRQTDDELETKTTKYTNKRGLRCSESVWMPELAAKLRNGDEVTGEELSRLQGVLPVYRKQLAAHFRSEMLSNDPTLREQAAKFGL